MALAAACCLLAAGTLAWQSLNQTALNELTGGATYANVELVKLERAAEGTAGGEGSDGDESGSGDSAADAAGTPLPGATFQLFTEDGAQLYGDFVTGPDGRVRANLPAGKYYFEETVPPSGYTFDVRDGAKVTRYPFEVTDDVGEKVTVTAYNVRLEGSLSIQKTVKNADGAALTESQRRQGFDFAVSFSKKGEPLAGPFSYSVDGGPAMSVANGGTLTLCHGQTAVFDDLPQGALYEVIEVPVEGYAVTSSGHRGNIGDESCLASFVNTYDSAAPSADAVLRVTKEVRNAGGGELAAEQLSQEFEFEVTLAPGADSVEVGQPSTGVVTSSGASFRFKLAHGQAAVIEGLAPGTSYIVEELASSLPTGCTPTATRYEGEAVGGSTALLPFVNVLGADPSGTGSLEVSKAVEGFDSSQPGHADAFSFQVRILEDGEMLEGSLAYSVGGEAFTVPNGGTVKLAHGQTAVFEGLEGGAEYEVVELVDPQSALEPAFTTARGSIVAGEAAEASFVNVEPVESQEAIVRVSKSLEGDCPEELAGRAFWFTLSYRNAAGVEVEERFSLRSGEVREFSVPLGAWYEVREDDAYAEGFSQSIVGGAGHATEALVEVEAVNAYVPEVPDDPDVPDVPPVDPDDPDDPVVPPIDPDDPDDPDNPDDPDDPDGPADPSDPDKPVTPDDPDAGRVIYVDPPVIIKAVEDKASDGAGAPDRRFEFRMIARDPAAPMPSGASEGVKSVFIENSGSAEFGFSAYTKPGTYVYDIVEVPVDHAHWRYDNVHYIMTVEVTEDTSGKLSATRSFKRIGVLTGAAIVSEAGTMLQFDSPADFENVYEGVGGMGSGANLEQTGDDVPWAALIAVLLVSFVVLLVAAIRMLRR